MRIAPALLALAGWSTAHAAPNLVVFLTDDLGGRDTTVYGSRDVRTPNIERLAAMGMTFENAFVASPACAPSCTALLTGLMPARTHHLM
ncbi:MAG: sulfatase-like hydrolase/transferase [Bryobacterales bacterium]|nr:sulfatase-like hydrolase/transferase [Bryobacterales bacterium]